MINLCHYFLPALYYVIWRPFTTENWSRFTNCLFLFRTVILLDLWSVSHWLVSLVRRQNPVSRELQPGSGKGSHREASQQHQQTRQHPVAAAGQQSSTHRAANLVKNRVHTIVTIQGEKLDLRHIPPSVPQTIPLTWGKVEGHIPINTV